MLILVVVVDFGAKCLLWSHPRGRGIRQELLLPPRQIRAGFGQSNGDPRGCDKLRHVSFPFCSALFLVKLASENWKSFGGSEDRSAEDARSPIGICQDSRCCTEKTLSGSKRCEFRHLACHWTRNAKGWGQAPGEIEIGMSFLACVEEAMEESAGLLLLEPTWEELKDELVVVVDALSASLPPTSSAQVTALDRDHIGEDQRGRMRTFAHR